MTKNRLLLLGLAVVALLILAPAAQADIFTDTFTLGLPNNQLSSCPGPYATLDVSLNTGTHVATFTFTRLDSYLMGDGSAVGVNLAGDFSAASSFIANNSLGNPVTLTRAAIPSQVDGFGTFNLVYDAANFGPDNRFITISFSATDTGTFDWTSIASLFAPSGGGNGGFFAVSHIMCPDGTTGYAAVPVPPTVYLMGSGLLGLAWLRWRRKG